MTAQPNLEAVERLEALARAATPGPWKSCGTIYEHMNCEVRSGPKGEGQGIAQVWDGPNAFKDGQFIAAANPEMILALISTIRSQAEALEKASERDRAHRELLGNAETARFHLQATEGGMLVGSALFDTIQQSRAALTPEVSK